MKVGIIGVGNMGSAYARLIMLGVIKYFEVGAFTRIKPEFEDIIAFAKTNSIPVFDSADSLFSSVENGELELDAIVVATPHYSHEAIAVRAFKAGIHVLTDKPLGVFSLQARNMIEAANEASKTFAVVFNQRTNPMYKRVKEIIESQKYGQLKRVNWVVTDWYRPDSYYKSSSWHATWDKDGGGVLLNQCPHNLDLLQWICGMPKSVQGFCHDGRFHDIEVEDDVTAYFEWENGANGTFITSTGDAPGVNRLEISLDEAMLVCENGVLKIGELEPEIGMKEAKYRTSSKEFFRNLYGVWKEEAFEKVVDPYKLVLENFSNVISGTDAKLIANGYEGINSLYLSNAIYLSSWEKCMIDIPKTSDEVLTFEKRFKDAFEKHAANS